MTLPAVEAAAGPAAAVAVGAAAAAAGLVLKAAESQQKPGARQWAARRGVTESHLSMNARVPAVGTISLPSLSRAEALWASEAR
jgi:hypothetical protein